MGKVANLFKRTSPKFQSSVVKTANRADQLTNIMVPVFAALAGLTIGGWVGLVLSLIAIPMAYAVWAIPPALSRFSYAAFSDKKAMPIAIVMALMSMFLTTVGVVGMTQYTNEISDNYATQVDSQNAANKALLSQRMLDKCHKEVAGYEGCNERAHIEQVTANALALAQKLPPFSIQQIKLSVFGAVLTGTALATVVGFFLAVSLALIQGFLPYFMAKSNQGSHEEILEGKKDHAA